MNRKSLETARVPAGTYWIGDPCYTIPTDEWMEWLDAADYTSPSNVLEARLDDNRYALALSTAYGDGEYLDQDRRNYGVDAGLIGVVSITWPEVREAFEKEGMRYLVTFDTEVEARYDDGLLTFGHIAIETNDSDPDEFEDESQW